MQSSWCVLCPHMGLSCGFFFACLLVYFVCFNFQLDREKEKLVKAASSWKWSTFGTLAFLRLPASKQEQNSEQHTKVTYYTNLIICIYLGGSKHLLALCEMRMPMAMALLVLNSNLRYCNSPCKLWSNIHVFFQREYHDLDVLYFASANRMLKNLFQLFS